MEIDRRTLLAAFAATALAAPAGSAARPAPAYVTACKNRNGYAAVFLDAQGQVLAKRPLPARGHGAAIAPDGGRAVLFGRRPGGYALAFALSGADVFAPVEFAPPPERLFYGHGCFSADGRLLYASENDFEAARGVIGVYDTRAGCRRVGEMPSHGVGPHEIVMLSDGRTIAVANGGIATHPDWPRMKLNLADMAPNLAYVDSRDGTLLETVELPPDLHQLSIRHMAEAAPGEIWWGGQHEGPLTEVPPLVGVHRHGAAIALLEETATPTFRNYMGSVAANPRSGRVAVASPRGGVFQVWDRATRRTVGSWRIADVCGVAPSGAGFLTTDGRGHVHIGEMAAGDHAVAWDNHVYRIDAAG